jgi:hypothetical protein
MKRGKLMKNSKCLLLLFGLFINLFLGSVYSLEGCSRGSAYKMSELFSADFIVRVTAIKATKDITLSNVEPSNSSIPNSTIEFKVEEVIWGLDVPSSFGLRGFLTQTDDFNDVPVPYKFIRGDGRRGRCFATSYKEGAQFLLFVRKDSVYDPRAGFTTNISALGPNNEQLRGADDPWIKWVKAYLSPCASQGKEATDFAEMSKAKMNTALKQQTSSLDKYRLAKCYLAKYGIGGSDTKNYLQIVKGYEEWNADKGVEH